MKIAFLSAFYPFRGGIAQFSASLFRLFEKEHEVKAFTFKRQYPGFLFPGETQYVTEKDHVDKIESIRVLDTMNPFSYFSTAKQINDFAPDILILRFWMPFFGPSMGTVAKLINPRTKVISIIDNAIPHEKRMIDRPFTKYFLKQNDGFVVMSEAVKSDLLSLMPGPANVIKIEHPLYDHFGKKMERSKAREQLGIDQNKKTILFFGFIRKYKGLDLLINAFNELDDSYQLVIAGECYESFEGYRQLIDSSKLRNNIHLFNSYISDSEVPVFFSAADVCVLPYRSATQSGITSISIHFDLPLIATDTGGLKEVIRKKNAGVIVDDISAEALRDAIRKYFDAGQQKTFTESIQSVKKTLSWENFGKQLLQFCDTL